MPVYEFVCLECGKEFSLGLTLNDFESKGITCPQCRSKTIEQLVTSCEVVTARMS